MEAKQVNESLYIRFNTSAFLEYDFFGRQERMKIARQACTITVSLCTETTAEHATAPTIAQYTLLNKIRIKFKTKQRKSERASERKKMKK